MSERGRYCSSGVLSFRRIRVNLPVVGCLESSQMPAQLMGVSTGIFDVQFLDCSQSQSRRPEHLNTR